MTFSLDMSEVSELSADLRALPKSVQREVPKVIDASALRIKNQMREEMGASKHFGHVADSITYDIHDGGYVAEIGPKKGRPGSIANIAYFGGGAWTGRINPGPGWQQGPGGGGTVADPRGALDAEVPNFERDLLDLVARVMGR